MTTNARAGSVGSKRTPEQRTRMRLAQLLALPHKRIPKGADKPNWKGGITTGNGYVKIKHGRRYVYQHRTIAEQHLGRKLRSSEIVHHRNHDKKDNRIENLQVLGRADHIRLHLHRSSNDSR